MILAEHQQKDEMKKEQKRIILRESNGEEGLGNKTF